MVLFFQRMRLVNTHQALWQLPKNELTTDSSSHPRTLRARNAQDSIADKSKALEWDVTSKYKTRKTHVRIHCWKKYSPGMGCDKKL